MTPRVPDRVERIRAVAVVRGIAAAIMAGFGFVCNANGKLTGNHFEWIASVPTHGVLLLKVSTK